MKYMLTLIAVITMLAETRVVAQDAKPEPGKKIQRRMELKGENAYIIREIGAVVSEEGGKIKVMMVPPQDRGGDDLQRVDLAEGDEIGMASGKTINSTKQLQEAYDKAKVGSEFTIGVRRDSKPHIVTIVKKDEKDMPKGMKMIIRKNKP